MKKTSKRMINIMLLVGMLLCFHYLNEVTMKIIGTSIKLYSLMDEIEMYNQNVIKTDEKTSEIELVMSERESKYYNSEDIIIRKYSNLPRGGKFLVLLAIIYSYYWMINRIILKIRSIFRKKKKTKSIKR